ncbi:Ribosomal RNA processing Brix domain protein, partial [Prunus dulcis]
CGRDWCQKNRLGLGVMTQPSPDIGRRSSRRKMAIFAWNFAGSDLPPPAAISGDQDRAIVSDPTVRSEPNLQDKCLYLVEPIGLPDRKLEVGFRRSRVA